MLVHSVDTPFASYNLISRNNRTTPRNLTKRKELSTKTPAPDTGGIVTKHGTRKNGYSEEIKEHLIEVPRGGIYTPNITRCSLE